MDQEPRQREQRASSARKKVHDAISREQTKAVLKAAGAIDPDDAAIEAASALAEERLVELATRAAEVSEDRKEARMSAASVAVAAQREAEHRTRQSF